MKASVWFNMTWWY